MNKAEAGNAIRRIKSAGNLVMMGDAVLIETTREPALDTVCQAIETLGGTVLDISDHLAPVPNGKVKKVRTLYTVVACIPTGIITE